VHARNAGLMAINATAEFYEADDCAMKLIPALSPLLIDKEKFHLSPLLSDMIELSAFKLPKLSTQF